MGQDWVAFVKEFEAHCRRRGITHRSASFYAKGNRLAYERLQQRMYDVIGDMQAFRVWMEQDRAKHQEEA